MVRTEVRQAVEMLPFGGILGNSVIVRVVQELIADPNSVYSPTDLSGLAMATPPAVRKSLDTLLKKEFIEKVGKNEKRQIYKVIPETKKFIALTLLSYAVVDDEQKTDLMEEAMRSYLLRVYQDAFKDNTFAKVFDEAEENESYADVEENFYYNSAPHFGSPITQ